MACSYGMAYADDGVRHVVLECVDEVQEVAAVVVPACCCCVSLSAINDRSIDTSISTRLIRGREKFTIRSENLLVQDPALSLAGYICNPDPPHASPFRSQPLIQVVPEGFVEFFGEAIGVGADEGDIACFWAGVIFGDVLVDVEA